MVLKRIFWAALGSLGVSALLTGPASANIPPPDSLVDVAKCIAANTPPKRTPGAAMTGIRVPAVVTTDEADKTPTLAALFSSGMANCTFDPAEMETVDGEMVPVYTGFLDINLAGRMMTAATRFGALDPEDDDYADDLAELQAEFTGPIFDAILTEVNARREADESIMDFNEAKTDFLLPTRPQKMVNGDTVDVDGDNEPDLEDTGAERARYLALAYTEGDNDETTEDERDISIRRLAGHEYNGEALDQLGNTITSFSLSPSEALVSDVDIDITDTTDIADLIGMRTTAMTDRNAAQALLDAEGTAGGIPLTQREREHLEDVVTFRNDEISKLNDAIDNIEGISDHAEVVREYRAQLANIRSLLRSAESDIDTQKTRNGDVRDTLIDPADQLATLVALAEADLADAEDRGLTGSALETYSKRVANAKKAQSNYTDATADSENPASELLDSLLADDDTGQALLDAVSSNHGSAVENSERLDTVEDNMADIDALTGEDGAVTQNTAAIEQNEADITSLDGRVTTNEETLVDHGMKLMQKKEYIDNLGAHIGVDPVTGMGTGANGMSRIDMNEHRSTSNMEAIQTNSGRIDANEGAIMMNSGRIDANEAAIAGNMGGIASNMNAIGSNSSAISDNRNMIGELSESLDVVRAGVAASMALAGMPAINGRGISIGVGSFDGESAFAVGFQIQGEMASFKVGVTSASGATGASAGVGFQF